MVQWYLFYIKDGSRDINNAISSLRKAENKREKKETAKEMKKTAFKPESYKFTRSILDDERSGALEAPLEDVYTYRCATFSQSNR